jgi:large subunit ribosomal protein L6
MSRIGKQPITIPAGVTVTIDGLLLHAKGPKGELSQKIHPQVLVTQQDGVLTVNVKDEDDKSQRALWGLFGSLVNNIIIGVTEGFTKQLDIAGVGFKAVVTGGNLVLNVGFSHQVNFPVPTGIEIKVEGNVITVTGIDKQLVGETAAQIRKVKKVEPYKGKGIKYVGEVVRRKAGKAAAKSK